MGCCICYAGEIKCTEIIYSEEKKNNSIEMDDFNDLSLSSDGEMPHLQDWIEYKNSKILSESTAVFSSVNYTCKKAGYPVKTLSNQGSIIDSFSVGLPSSFFNK